MPTNESDPFAMYSLYGVPLFTYGMLGITTLVLAYVTFMDDGEGNSFANPNDQVPQESPSTFSEEIAKEPEPEVSEPEVPKTELPQENPEVKGGNRKKKNKTKRRR